jgi:hypothetical protein
MAAIRAMPCHDVAWKTAQRFPLFKPCIPTWIRLGRYPPLYLDYGPFERS